MMVVGKLVRDKIPDIIKTNGEVPIVRIADERVLGAPEGQAP